MDESVACPRCKTTKYRNPALVLMVNVCGHALCENCVELLFVRGSGACPQCKIPLRRTNFRARVFEDPVVEKEVDIRRKIMRDFNRKEDSFSSLREFNDYLEMVETIIFNLTNGIDVDETRKRVEQYKRENQDQIKKNRSKLSRDEEEIEELILEEASLREKTRVEVLKEQDDVKREKQRNKEMLINELMYSEKPADRILEDHRRELESQNVTTSQIPKARQNTFSTGISVGKQGPHFMPLPMDQGTAFIYEPLCLKVMGPEVPSMAEIRSDGYLDNIRPASDQDMGGGYVAELGVSRALTDAFSGLLFSFDLIQHETTDIEMMSIS